MNILSVGSMITVMSHVKFMKQKLQEVEAYVQPLIQQIYANAQLAMAQHYMGDMGDMGLDDDEDYVYT